MEIIVVGYLGSYGSMGQWIYDILKQLGYKVTGVDRYGEIPVRKALYFFVDSSEDYSYNIPDIPYPKIFWSMDAHMPGGDIRVKSIVSKCNLVFSSNKEHGVELLKKLGIESTFIPLSYRKDYFRVNKPLKERRYDVVMIGNPNSQQRVDLWNILKRFNSFCGTVATLSEYSSIMENAKIVINQPTEPWDTILNNRFYEALGCGSLLLQKRLKTKLIEELGFKNGADFIYWNDLSQIEGMVETALEEIDVYQTIANNGNLKVQKYEMLNQLQSIINVSLDRFKEQLNDN